MTFSPSAREKIDLWFDTPHFFSLRGDLGGRILHQVGGETLGLEGDRSQLGVAVDVLHALPDPAQDILAHVEEHADFLIAAFEQRSFQVFGGLLPGRQQALQHQAGARAFHDFAGAGLVGKRMKNQGRKLVGC